MLKIPPPVNHLDPRLVSYTAVVTVVALSPDEATEGATPPEALPLIFEPLKDPPSERAPLDMVVTPAPGNLQPLVPADSDGPSRASSPPIPDWPSPWQTSGGEQLESTTLPSTSVSPQPSGGEDYFYFLPFPAQSRTYFLTVDLFVRCCEDAKIRGQFAHPWPHLLIRAARHDIFNGDNPSSQIQIRVGGDGVRR